MDLLCLRRKIFSSDVTYNGSTVLCRVFTLRAIMIHSFLRTPLAFQAVRSIGTCNLHHLSNFCRQVPSIPPCELGARFRHTSPFLSFPRRNAWTSSPIMTAPAGDDFQGREWKEGEAHEVLPRVFLGSMVRRLVCEIGGAFFAAHRSFACSSFAVKWLSNQGFAP